MSGHTPGPWQVEDDEMRPTAYSVFGQNHELITSTSGFVAAIEGAIERKQANARLIAAAPELLAALKDLVRESESADVHDTAIVVAMAAIAKAEGLV